MFGVSMWELMLVGLVLFLVVGPKKLPELAKTLGKALGSLRRSVDDFKKDVDVQEELSFIKDVRNIAKAELDGLNEEEEEEEPPVTPEPITMPSGPSALDPLSSGRQMVTPGQGAQASQMSEEVAEKTPYASPPGKNKPPKDRPARRMIKPGKLT